MPMHLQIVYLRQRHSSFLVYRCGMSGSWEGSEAVWSKHADSEYAGKPSAGVLQGYKRWVEYLSFGEILSVYSRAMFTRASPPALISHSTQAA